MELPFTHIDAVPRKRFPQKKRNFSVSSLLLENLCEGAEVWYNKIRTSNPFAPLRRERQKGWRIMKRLIRGTALLAAAALTLSLAACGGQTQPQSDPEPTPEEILAQAQQLSQESLESMSASVTAQVDMEVQAGDQSQSVETTTAMDLVYFSDPLKLRAETSMDMGDLGSFTATIYAQQEDNAYTMYTDVGGQWFRESASAELLEQYNASSELNTYLNSTEEWTFQQEEEVDGVTVLKYSGTVTGTQVSALMEESGVLDSLGTMQQLGVSTENLQGMTQNLGDMTIQMWIDPEICYPVRYEVDMTDVCNTLMDNVLQTLEGMGQNMDGVSIHYPQVQVIMTCSDFNSAADFDIPAEALAA